MDIGTNITGVVKLSALKNGHSTESSVFVSQHKGGVGLKSLVKIGYRPAPHGSRESRWPVVETRRTDPVST